MIIDPRRLVVLAIAVIALMLLLSACSAKEVPATARILHGEAHSAEGAISVKVNDWWYAIPRDDVRWVDSAGSLHESGRPECLPPQEATIPVTFAAVEVTVEDATWRQVVWVSCDSE